MRRDSRRRDEPRRRSRSRPRRYHDHHRERRSSRDYGDRRRDARSRDRDYDDRRRDHHRSRSRGRHADQNRHTNYSRRQERRSNYSPRRSRSHSSSRMTHRHSRRMPKGGRSASTDHGHEGVCRSDSRAYKEKKRNMSDDSASHDDTIGSYEGKPGDCIDNRYKIIKDAGLGTFGRVVLCRDLDRNDEIVALKVVRKVERYSDSAKIEAAILKDVNERDTKNASLCVKMHRWFEFRGHVVLVFETLGGSLYDYLKKHEYKPFPVASVRAYAWQLLTSLSYLESISLIHTDLKPENILLCDDTEDPALAPMSPRSRRNRRCIVPPASDRVKLIDFGGATYQDEARSGIINTRQYRSPEVMLGLGWSYPSDIWSAGCIIAELYLGELLFSTHENLEHLALIERCIAPFPKEMVERADKQAKKYFTSTSQTLRWPENAASQESIDHVRKMRPLREIIAPEDKGLLSLLEGMLTMDPARRLSARDALRHDFFTGISLDNLHA
ncbi:CMGC/CLK protein kinase [Saprolegnia diclina VS20]|uniref:CMGC/CLK protein kinase n=1 Tax=Saprolegnia diclina (strain VS20) TaxID=1156394 RepID=T0QEV6_SAPDV|nr:CMGC/CLK protein kinase [Saprolegnia diclina VS20]EQC33276.1 CMGC/CLK protein kinase [Saprolegnia diclina VS20]|eukprot:XP_008613399.1 CMGC/CLK protein kinase [Saprolegnia diclina VS20]